MNAAWRLDRALERKPAEDIVSRCEVTKALAGKSCSTDIADAIAALTLRKAPAVPSDYGCAVGKNADRMAVEPGVARGARTSVERAALVLVRL